MKPPVGGLSQLKGEQFILAVVATDPNFVAGGAAKAAVAGGGGCLGGCAAGLYLLFNFAEGFAIAGLLGVKLLNGGQDAFGIGIVCLGGLPKGFHGLTGAAGFAVLLVIGLGVRDRVFFGVQGDRDRGIALKILQCNLAQPRLPVLKVGHQQIGGLLSRLGLIRLVEHDLKIIEPLLELAQACGQGLTEGMVIALGQKPRRIFAVVIG